MNNGFLSFNKPGNHLLHYAVRDSMLRMVESLVQRGMNVSQENPDGMIPLHYAGRSDTVECYSVCRLLLEAGSSCNRPDLRGRTPFHNALAIAPLNIVQLMLEYGADVTLVDEIGRTALHCAAANRRASVINYAFSLRKLNIEDRTSGGWSALDCAAHFGNFEVCEFLLKRGALVNEQNPKTGETPLVVAVLSRHYEMQSQTVQILLEYGADVAVKYKDSCILDMAKSNRACESTRMILTQHMAKMQQLNSDITQENRQLLDGDEFYTGYYNACLKELTQMRQATFYNNVSAFNVLLGSKKVISGYARNEELVKSFEGASFDTQFPIYSSSMKKRFHVGVERQRRRKPAARILSDLLAFHDPLHPVIQKILSCIKDEDLQVLEM